VSPSSLLEKIASIREGSSCRANARLIKRPQAGWGHQHRTGVRFICVRGDANGQKSTSEFMGPG
jgi:hypothetical protein